MRNKNKKELNPNQPVHSLRYTAKTKLSEEQWHTIGAAARLLHQTVGDFVLSHLTATAKEILRQGGEVR